MKRLSMRFISVFFVLCLMFISTSCDYPDPESSVLLKDEFSGSRVDSAKWYIPTWVSSTDGTFVGQTQFRCSQNSKLPLIRGGDAIIALNTYNPTGRSFYGTDLISKQTFEPGCMITVVAKLDSSMPEGIVGGIFLYKPPDGFGDTLHDEIDFELLSNDPDYIHTNVYGDEPLGTGHPDVQPYDSGSVFDYHLYQIEWLSYQISWFVDGDLIRTVNSIDYDIPEGPMRMHFNAWVPDSHFTDAYNPNLDYTTSSGDDQEFSMNADYIVVQKYVYK